MKKETMKCRKEIRLYSWELEELQKQAEKMGLSDSQYLRMLITNRPRDYPEIRQELERMNQEINRIGVNINQITHNNNSALYSREDKHRLYVFLKPGAGKAVGYGNYKVPAHETGKNGLSGKTSGKWSSLYYEPGENRTWPLCLWT